MCSERISPPGTGPFSSRTDSTPSRARRWASVQPVSPAPTIRTRDIRRSSKQARPATGRRALVWERAPELEREQLQRLEHGMDGGVAGPVAGGAEQAADRRAEAPPEEPGTPPGGKGAGVAAREPGPSRAVQGLLADEARHGLAAAVHDGRLLAPLDLPPCLLEAVGEVGVLGGADVLAEAADLLEGRAPAERVGRLREAPAAERERVLLGHQPAEV